MIEIKIGSTQRTFHIYKTRAPRRYDYGYVIELYCADDPKDENRVQDRIILIPEESIAYQTGRYHSGLFPTEKNDDIPVSEIERILVDRLYRNAD